MGILTLLKANLKHRKSNFISVFILMMTVSTILTSALSISDNVTRRVKQANQEIGTGDIVAFISDALFTDEMHTKLEESDAVEKTNVIDSFYSTDTVINNINSESLIFFTAYDYVDRPYEVFNDEENAFIDNPVPLNDGEIYLPFGLKKVCSCEKGDEVSLKLPERTVKFTIAGFVEEPFTGCDIISINNLFITENDLNTIIKECSDVRMSSMSETKPISLIKIVHIFGSDEYQDDVNELSRAVNEDCEIIDEAEKNFTRDNMQTYTLLTPLIMCGVLFLFLAIMMTVVGLVLSNNIGTSIEMEYVNIGILKSQGFSKSKIRLVFLLQYLFPAVLGALIGLILAFPLINFVRPLFIAVSCVLVSNELLIGKSVTVLLVILVLVGLFIYVKTARVSKISPIKAISGGLDDVFFTSIIRTPVIGKSKSMIGIRLVFRQLTSNIKQYVGICIIFTFIVFYLSTCNALFKNFTVSFYDELYGTVSADVKVEYNDRIDMREEVEKDISVLSAINGSYSYAEVDLFVDDVPYSVQVVDDMSYLANFMDGKIPEYDNELLISNYLRKKSGMNIGDKLILKHEDILREFIICGTYDSANFAGRGFALSFEAIKTLDSELEANSIYYIIEDKAQAEKINEAIDEEYNEFGIETSNAKRKSEATINMAIGVVKIMILFIFFIAIVFAVIVIWMVCKKSFLKERFNIGIYKAYGFSSFSLKMQFCFRYLIVALTACVFGVTLYTFFGDALNLTTFMMLGVTQFHAPLTLESYIIAPSLICFFVFLASFITMGKISKVSTRELVTE